MQRVWVVFYAEEGPAKSCQAGERSGVFRAAQVPEVKESPVCSHQKGSPVTHTVTTPRVDI